MSVSCLSCLLSRDEIGEIHTSFGVEFVPCIETPLGERQWVDIGADDGAALQAHALFALLGTVEPFFVRVEEPLPVLHDSQDRRVIFWPVPGHADECHAFLSHGESLSC